MNPDLATRVDLFNAIVHETEVLLSIARDSELQSAMVVKVAGFLPILTKWKQEAIAKQDEADANRVLGMECVLGALSAELQMWLALKKEEPERAWEHLIAAQSAAIHATRTHSGFAHLEAHASRLLAIEELVFPPQKFISSGLIVSESICSICNTNYDDCSHVAGMPYWGEFCARKLNKFVVDHVALVDEPASKLCRVTHFSVEGGRRNRMTWRVERSTEPKNENQKKDGLAASGIVMTVDELAT